MVRRIITTSIEEDELQKIKANHWAYNDLIRDGIRAKESKTDVKDELEQLRNLTERQSQNMVKLNERIQALFIENDELKKKLETHRPGLDS